MTGGRVPAGTPPTLPRSQIVPKTDPIPVDISGSSISASTRANEASHQETLSSVCPKSQVTAPNSSGLPAVNIGTASESTSSTSCCQRDHQGFEVERQKLNETIQKLEAKLNESKKEIEEMKVDEEALLSIQNILRTGYNMLLTLGEQAFSGNTSSQREFRKHHKSVMDQAVEAGREWNRKRNIVPELNTSDPIAPPKPKKRRRRRVNAY